jgi:imidazolonepropionase-like amidohydrolase
MKLVQSIKIALLGVGVLSLSTAALADQFAIVGGQVHTLNKQGILAEGTVLIKNGKIERIIKGSAAPRGYEHIDATGKVVTPGFIGAYTALGLVEVGLSAGQVDSSTSEHPVTTVGAAIDVSYAVNSDSSLIPITRIEGFTSAATGIEYSDYMFKGQGALIKLTDSDGIMQSRAFMALSVNNSSASDTGGTRGTLWVALNQALGEANAAMDLDLGPTEAWHGMISRADAKALVPVLKGDTPLLIKADRKADLLNVLALQQRFPKLNLVLVSAAEAWRVADELAAADIPVILNPEYNLPGAFDTLGSTMANAGRLEKAGVKVAIGIETHNIRLATQHAGNAVANGLSHAEGIAALSKNVAEIFGVEDQIGSLAQGMHADIVVWSGDPLEVTEAPEHVFIQGQPINLESRQTLLRDRYLDLQDKVPMPHHKP